MPAVLLVCGLIALLIAGYTAYTNPQNSGVIALASAGIAGIALIYNAQHSARQARIRFTLDAAFQRFANATYSGHAAALYRNRAHFTPNATESDLRRIEAVPDGDGKPGTGSSLAESTIYLLNYWEFLATAYVDGHLDRETFCDVVGEYIETLVERTSPLIGEVRANDGESWEHLVALYFRFAKSERRGATLRRLGPASRRLSPWEEYQWRRLMPRAPAADPVRSA